LSRLPDITGLWFHHHRPARPWHSPVTESSLRSRLIEGVCHDRNSTFAAPTPADRAASLPQMPRLDGPGSLAAGNGPSCSSHLRMQQVRIQAHYAGVRPPQLAACLRQQGCRCSAQFPMGERRPGSGADLMPDWQRLFDGPIPLPRGRQLVTLRDAAEYITRLPKAEHDAPEWQTAIEALLLVAELGGPTMFARVGLMRAVNQHVERVFDSSKKDRHWGRRKLARDR
jgi:hypothetical protein